MDTFEVESCVRGRSSHNYVINVHFMCGTNIGGIKFSDFTENLPIRQIKNPVKVSLHTVFWNCLLYIFVLEQNPASPWVLTRPVVWMARVGLPACSRSGTMSSRGCDRRWSLSAWTRMPTATCIKNTAWPREEWVILLHAGTLKLRILTHPSTAKCVVVWWYWMYSLLLQIMFACLYYTWRATRERIPCQCNYQYHLTCLSTA